MTPAILIAISILARLFPIVIDRLQKGENWRNIRLGDIEDTKTWEESLEELKKKQETDVKA